MKGENRMMAAEAANILGVAAATVRQMADRGTLKCIRTSNGVRLFRKQAVEKLFKARKVVKKTRRKLKK